MVITKKVLITGGIKSGKSQYAIAQARSMGLKKAFLATAEQSDDEMRARIKRHKDERGDDFITFEEPIKLVNILQSRIEQNFDVVVIDCMTLWINNLFFKFEKNVDKIEPCINRLVQYIEKSSLNIIIVTNEVGCGIIPENKLSRDFGVVLGITNQKLAGCCNQVIHMVAGIPQWVKREAQHASS